jgi:hypothetical protein
MNCDFYELDVEILNNICINYIFQKLKLEYLSIYTSIFIANILILSSKNNTH